MLYDCKSLADYVEEVDVAVVDLEGLVFELCQVEEVQHQNAHQLACVNRLTQLVLCLLHASLKPRNLPR